MSPPSPARCDPRCKATALGSLPPRQAPEAITQVEEFAPDLILLDLGLPDVDGVDLTAGLRKHTQAPIIVLSVRGADRDKISALDSGADDYLTKPFSIGELLARIRVALRHAQPATPASAPPQPIAINGIVLNCSATR